MYKADTLSLAIEMSLAHWEMFCNVSVADPGGAKGPAPIPVKTSQKEDGCHAAPQVSRVIGPPLDKFLDPLLHIYMI